MVLFGGGGRQPLAEPLEGGVAYEGGTHSPRYLSGVRAGALVRTPSGAWALSCVFLPHPG